MISLHRLMYAGLTQNLLRVPVMYVNSYSQNAWSVQSMIELSRTQDEEVGDGTTSVIILGS